ncbi:MAG: sodium:solute symporter [Proteobacteria bacterium]|nr:sodium:solute symporter [Pseudomonadota bacterium]
MQLDGALASLDMAVLVGYFVLAIGAGLFFRRIASKGIESYFLGNRRIPWWVLGASGTASNFDMAGTMIIVSFVFAIGLQGFWVAMRGGMCLPLGLLMVYMGKWLQRSRVMTTAEWMELRFGSGAQGQAARSLSAVANLVVTLAMLTYFVTGTGKFLAVFIPLPPIVCSLLMICAALLYTVLSGLYGVVFTDILQELLMVGTALYIGYEATALPDHDQLMALSGSSWSSFVPRWTAEPMAWLAQPAMYQFFGLAIVFWIARGLLEGAGGLTGGYMPQRYYAAKNDRHASLMTAEWIVLLLFRWVLIAGVAVLALSLAHGNSAIGTVLRDDPEKALPMVLAKALPAGIRGLAISGLIAAAMSTFDSTVNAGAAYWVRDIYERYINPHATSRQLIRQSYLASLMLAITSIIMGLFVRNIDDIWSWITGPLSAGLFAPIILRWYWERLTGYGFALSTGFGLAVSIALKLFFPEMAIFISFPLTWSVSLIAGIAGSLLTEPTDMITLERFWIQIRPFGLWTATRSRIQADLTKLSKRESRRDLLNLPIAIAWHLSGVVAAISIVLHKWQTLTGAGAVFLGATIALYFTWYKRLPAAR